MKSKSILLFFVLLIFPGMMLAQKSKSRMEISGTVLDASEKPIGNAIVMIDGKNTSTVTGSDGKYKIKVKSGAQRIGIFTFTNGIKEESIGGRTEIDFNFGTASGGNQNNVTENDQKPGEEGVNTGYGYVKKKNVAGDIDKIDGSNKKFASYKSVYEMIQREVSGVKIVGNDIIIRDSKDFFGSIPALIVVDGAYVDDLSNIQPATVESIEVLKGASAAMYGSRGYGGVIILKTKLKN